MVHESVHVSTTIDRPAAEVYEYAALVTSLDAEILTLGQLYAERLRHDRQTTLRIAFPLMLHFHLRALARTCRPARVASPSKFPTGLADLQRDETVE